MLVANICFVIEFGNLSGYAKSLNGGGGQQQEGLLRRYSNILQSFKPAWQLVCVAFFLLLVSEPWLGKAQVALKRLLPTLQTGRSARNLRS